MLVHAAAEARVDPHHAVPADRAAVGAGQKAAPLHQVEVAPDGVARDLEQGDEFGHGHLAALVEDFEQPVLPDGRQRVRTAFGVDEQGRGRIAGRHAGTYTRTIQRSVARIR